MPELYLVEVVSIITIDLQAYVMSNCFKALKKYTSAHCFHGPDLCEELRNFEISLHDSI